MKLALVASLFFVLADSVFADTYTGVVSGSKHSTTEA
jgi:hypothetical protein